MRIASLARLVVAGAFASVIGTSAQAQPFAYSTLGTFTGTNCLLAGCGNLGWNGGIYVGYDEQLPVAGNAPATVSLGFFDADGVRGLFGSPSMSVGGEFFLTIVQYQPSVGLGTFDGSFAGTLSLSNSNLIWTPNQTVMTIGSMRYELTESSYLMNLPGNQQGKLQVFANVSSATTVTPEPGTIALLGTGLLGLGGFGLKRRRQNAA